MKVAITGASGQLGRALIAGAPADIEVLPIDRSTMDLADIPSIGRCVDALRPNVLVNAAAFTDVDLAESRREAAYAINAGAVGAMAEACARLGTALLHVSTDYVFDGTRGRPYAPGDDAEPSNVYGASKLEGERRIRTVAGLNWTVLRTSWLYSARGRNFVLTILRLLRERGTLSVVCDQTGSPTSAKTLAQIVWMLTRGPHSGEILHYADAGTASRYDFAVAICEEAAARGLIPAGRRILPTTSAEYPLPAKRPEFTVLDARRTLARTGASPVHWREALRQVLDEVQP